MRKLTLVALAVASAVLLNGCSATATTTASQTADVAVAQNVAPVVKADIQATALRQGQQLLTLEQAMSNPDWLGRQPERYYWQWDSKHISYTRKQQGNELRDLFVKAINEQGNGDAVTLASQHQFDTAQRVYSHDGQRAAYVFNNDIFIVELANEQTSQLTKTVAAETNLQFLNDGRLAYQVADGVVAVNLSNGQTEQLLSWKFAEQPNDEVKRDYIDQEQHKLIQFVALQAKNKADRKAQQQALQQQNATMVAEPFYFGKGKTLVNLAISPTAGFAIAAVTDDRDWREDGDIMPNYITDNGRIAAQPARRRVHDEKPQNTELWLLNLQTGEQHSLSYSALPGFDEDVLASVKAENAKRNGETYVSIKAARDINLISDWDWDGSAIRWHLNGQQVAVMLESWDNKDRWLATVDVVAGKLVNQHRLHDDAWVNYNFNQFGWLNNSETLYFLSEQTGYSQLYTKTLTGKAQAVTKGQFEVSDLTLTKDDHYAYFKANQKHPGVYEIYRVALSSGQVQPLTDLNGMTDYKLSPDESKLLLQHSTTMMPPELYVQNADGSGAPARLTNTVSEQFLNTKLVAPKVVAVPSSHGAQPIYAKVYLPTDEHLVKPLAADGKRRAVIFNHGAGYLQNSDLGWSGYFREFMFHSFLAQQGYVVMDMDYRASKGYGRDWRTAIYRQMGTPEIQDLEDGVQYLVANANVDSKRVGTYGGSYGGFMTFMALLTKPDLFQAGAALRPVTDWAHYNGPYTSNILNYPDVDPIAYERSSPIYFAEGLKNHLLINAPMVDDNVFFQDVVRIVQRFIELEKENFETAIFPVEPHGFRQPSSWLDEYRRIYKLFEQNL